MLKKVKLILKKEAIEDGKNKAKKGRVSGLITQFKTFQDKPGKRSYRELLFMQNILGWIEKWEVLKMDAAFDPTAELAKLDAAETDNQGKLAKYNHWVGHGTHFTEQLDNWKNDDGKYFNEEAVKRYLQSIKDALESVGRGLDPVEQNELDQLTHYIENGEVPIEERILPMDLKAALGTKINVFSSLVQIFSKHWF